LERKLSQIRVLYFRVPFFITHNIFPFGK
jgi:hypothetical protein